MVYTKESLNIAKVFFAYPTENLDNFRFTKHGFGRKHSACLDNYVVGGLLPIVYSISSGCGVRLFLFALRLSRTFGESYENGSTPLYNV